MAYQSVAGGSGGFSDQGLCMGENGRVALIRHEEEEHGAAGAAATKLPTYVPT